MTYDTSEFHDWLEEPPEHLLEDDAGDELEAWKEKHGLRPDAPQSARDAFEEYLKAYDSVWRAKLTYKSFGFSSWLNDMPGNFDDEADFSAIIKSGLRNDAPQSAKREFGEFLKVMDRREKNKGWKLFQH